MMTPRLFCVFLLVFVGACSGDSADPPPNTSGSVSEVSQDGGSTDPAGDDPTTEEDGEPTASPEPACETLSGHVDAENNSCYSPQGTTCIGEFTCSDLEWKDCLGGCQGHGWIDCWNETFSCSCIDGAFDCTRSCDGFEELTDCGPCDPFLWDDYLDIECPCDIDGCLGYPCAGDWCGNVILNGEFHAKGKCGDFDGTPLCTMSCSEVLTPGIPFCPEGWSCEETAEQGLLCHPTD